jgi:hypothetical protein
MLTYGLSSTQTNHTFQTVHLLLGNGNLSLKEMA